MNQEAVPVKIIMVGSISVGKTSLVTKYATGKHLPAPKSTQNASYVEKKKTVNGIKFEIRLWDTAGQEKYKSLTKLFIKDAKIAILVYSIDNEESFDKLDEWLKVVKNANEENVIYAVVANKSDLASDDTIPDEKGQEYAKKIGAEWRLTSSKNDGIEKLIDDLFLKYYQLNFNMTHTASSSITLSTEISKVEKKGCCGGGGNDANTNKNIANKTQKKEKEKE